MRFLVAIWFTLFSSICLALPTSPSVTFGTTTDPKTLSETQFNKYDGSVFVKTSDGTANGMVESVWHYSIKHNKWVKVPTGITSNAVDSVFGRNGVVTAQAGDYSWAQISSKPTFATVATSGSYTDLSNRPTIPAQYNPSAGTGIVISGTYPNQTISSSVPIFVRKALSANVGSTTTARADVTGWSFAVTSGKSYRVEIVALYQSAANTTGGSIGFVLPTGVGSIFGFVEGDVANTTVATTLRRPIYAIDATNTTTGSFITTTGVGVINSPHSIHSVLTFNCTTSGTFQVQWATEVAASAAQLNSGSAMYVTEF